jgi:hypothetical protein
MDDLRIQYSVTAVSFCTELEPDLKSGLIALRFAESNSRFSSRFERFQKFLNWFEPVQTFCLEWAKKGFTVEKL